MPFSAYRPLDVGRNEIRLIYLLPGTEDDPVHCTLKNVSLGEPCSYLALSYTWGDPSDPASIHIDGQHFNVTRNLEKSLKAIRATHQISAEGLRL
jgi:hypothetical protein